METTWQIEVFIPRSEFKHVYIERPDNAEGIEHSGHSVYLKAKFLMTITHDKSIDAFFNAPKKNIAPVRGKPDQVRTRGSQATNQSILPRGKFQPRGNHGNKL